MSLESLSGLPAEQHNVLADPEAHTAAAVDSEISSDQATKHHFSLTHEVSKEDKAESAEEDPLDQPSTQPDNSPIPPLNSDVATNIDLATAERFAVAEHTNAQEEIVPTNDAVEDTWGQQAALPVFSDVASNCH